MTLDALVGRSFSVDGYVNPVSYDESHRNNYGFYVCKVCLRSFYPSDGPVHREGCALKAHSPQVNSPEFVYVFGPNEIGIMGPLETADIEKIKELAKQRFLPN